MLLGGGFARGGEVSGGMPMPGMEMAGMGAEDPGAAPAPMGEAEVLGEGLIASDTGGRSDLLHRRAERGSYVIPADVVSGVGEGNTDAGARRLGATIPQGQLPGLARGGLAAADLVDIRVSGGEFMVSPASVAGLGGGDHARGAKRLDEFIAAVRAHVQKKAATMPPPR